MRKDFRPKLEVRRRIEDRLPWRVYDNGVAGMHEGQGGG